MVSGPSAGAFQWGCESLVMESRIIFAGLSILYLLVILLPELLKLRNSRLFSTVLPLSFLVLYSAGAVFLLQTTESLSGVKWQTEVTANGETGPEDTQAPVPVRK